MHYGKSAFIWCLASIVFPFSKEVGVKKAMNPSQFEHEPFKVLSIKGSGNPSCLRKQKPLLTVSIQEEEQQFFVFLQSLLNCIIILEISWYEKNIHTENSTAWFQEEHIWKTTTFYFTFSIMLRGYFVNILKFVA